MKVAARFAALVVAASLSLLLLSVSLPLAQPALAAGSSNAASEVSTVLVKIDVHDVDGTRTYQIVTTTDGATRKLESGSRVAIQPKPGAVPPGTVPVASVQYQAIGFSAELNVRTADSGKYRIQTRIEDSVVNDSVEGLLPQIDHHIQELHAFVELGEAFTATSVAGGDAGDYRITIELLEF